MSVVFGLHSQQSVGEVWSSSLASVRRIWYGQRGIVMERVRLVVLSCGLILIPALVFVSGLAQAPDALRGLTETQVQSLSAPYKGITTGGTVAGGLFHIRQTGVSTKPIRAAAEALLAALTETQRTQTLFPIDDREWRLWINTPGPARQGTDMRAMSDDQRTLVTELVAASLSAKGMKKTQDIMKLNETLGEITKNANFTQWRYFLTVMGTPSDTEPWGWQIDGHHLVINYFVLGDQVVMTPTFMGSEPVRADMGKFQGTIVLQDEQDKGFRLFTALTPEQRATATIRGDKGMAEETLAGAYQDNASLNFAGIRFTVLNEHQQELLLNLVSEYIDNLRDGHAQVRMDEVRQHLRDTYFAWIGGTDPSGVFYYRVQSPVVIIEFDHQQEIARSPRLPVASRNHIHTVVRTPNGNDYGKDLLRQHYLVHPH
jgi:hypothetical protein